MKAQYFTFCQTQEQVKRLFRELCFKHHPDKGGDVRTMQEINAEYAEAIRRTWWSDPKNADNQTESAFASAYAESEDFRAKIEAIINCEGLVIEVCGRWIWVTGETKAHKDTLKGNGYFWSAKKLAWYWRPAEEKSRFYRGKRSLDEIREMFGSDRQHAAKRTAIA